MRAKLVMMMVKLVMVMVKVIFTARGFIKFVTQRYCDGTPRFYNVIANDGEEWDSWRFYGGIPLLATDPVTVESLVRRETVEDWEYLEPWA